jgi:tetratricopeptide (TPR) repeat protein
VQPLLLVCENLHWIDAETQAVLDSLIESLPTARILLLVNYRPEYQHGWGNKTYYMQLRLDPLPPASAEDLLQTLLGRDPRLEPLRQHLITQTQGNPLFLEESVRTLMETGVLVGERGAYRLAKPLDSLQVPATVQALLAARIDRLPPEDKRLFQTAAVLGAAYALAGRSVEALPLLEQAVEQSTSRGYLHYYALGLTHLGEAYLLAGRMAEATRCARRALEYVQTHRERGREAWAVWFLGEMQTHQPAPDVASAEAHYRRALALAEELGIRPLQAHCRLGLGTLYAKIGQREQAGAELTAAIALYRAMDMTFWLTQAESALAQLDEQ